MEELRDHGQLIISRLTDPIRNIYFRVDTVTTFGLGVKHVRFIVVEYN